MRRIIKKTVTVVTTTTWKISWEPDKPHAENTADAAGLDGFPQEHSPTTLLETNPGPIVIEETATGQDEIQVQPRAEAAEQTHEEQ